METILKTTWQVMVRTWVVLGEMSPWVLGGFIIAGVLSLWLNAQVVRRHFGGGRLAGVFKAVALGVPLPVCSCGVIPLAASLRKHGASRGPTAAFLMSTPQTGVDSIAVTYGLMGPLFAVLRPLAALVSGILCGSAVAWFPSREEAPQNNHDDDLEAESASWWKRVLHNGFVVLPRSVGGALIVGALVSALVITLVPNDYLSQKVSNTFVQMLIMLAFGVPVYICSTAAVPFAMGLMAAGLTPAAAMVFLIGGSGSSASTLLAVWRLLGARSTLVYLAVLSACALGFGFVADALVPAGWMPPGIQTVTEHAHHASGMAWKVHVQAALLIGVIAWSKWGKRLAAAAD